MFIKLLLIVLTSNFLSAYVPDTKAGSQNELPDAIEGVGIDEKLNQSLPRNLKFHDDQGNSVKIADYLGKGRPVILSMVYFFMPESLQPSFEGCF